MAKKKSCGMTVPLEILDPDLFQSLGEICGFVIGEASDALRWAINDALHPTSDFIKAEGSRRILDDARLAAWALNNDLGNLSKAAVRMKGAKDPVRATLGEPSSFDYRQVPKYRRALLFVALAPDECGPASDRVQSSLFRYLGEWDPAEAAHV